MYNTNVECTYSSNVFLETDDISEKDKYFVRNCLYRQEFLNIFGLEEYNDDIIHEKIHELYEKIKETELLLCMKDVMKKFSIDDLECGLYILFSYDFLHLFHPCVSNYLETGKINTELLEKLKKVIEN